MILASCLPVRLKLRILLLKNRLFPKVKVERSLEQHIWFFLAADYGNLGDVAITKAQREYLQVKFPKAKVVEVPISQTINLLYPVQKVIKPMDIVTVVGGGNMGDLYDDIEFLRQRVIKAFHNNRTISFPQTFYFSETPFGRKRLHKAVSIYSKHRSLLLLARDARSYALMKNNFFKNEIKLAPDIVLSLTYKSTVVRKRIALLCLREDKERGALDVPNLESLKSYLKSNYESIEYTDTQIDDMLVKRDGGDKHLDLLLDKFSSASLIVTDRLHGMIFAFITHTPALVFDNSNGKIFSTYPWIQDCGFIHLVNENTDFHTLRFTDNFANTKAALDFEFQNMI